VILCDSFNTRKKKDTSGKETLIPIMYLYSVNHSDVTAYGQTNGVGSWYSVSQKFVTLRATFSQKPILILTWSFG